MLSALALRLSFTDPSILRIGTRFISSVMILTYSRFMSIADLPHAECVDRASAQGRPRDPPGGGPHCAVDLDNLWLPDFLPPGYSPSQRSANVYKVQLNLVEKSMPLVLHKSLEGSREPCSKSSVLEGFVAKRPPPPADPKRCSS